MRERILDSDIEKITGREIPKVHVAGKEPVVFYMETLSQIYIVGKNIKAINEKETEIQESFFPKRERIEFATDGCRRQQLGFPVTRAIAAFVFNVRIS